MIEVKANVNGLDVAASGVIQVSSDTVDLKVNGMDMQIRFLSAAPYYETRFNTLVQDGTLVLNLYNFNSLSCEGQLSPKVVGNIFGRSLLMAFSVVTLEKESNSRILTYTFYLGAQN